MRILVIESDREASNRLETALFSAGYETETADDGARGSYLARTSDYRLVILSAALPLKSGIEACSEIRESGRRTPILVVSGTTESRERARFLDAGADDCLSGSYCPEEFLARVRGLLRRGAESTPATYQYGALLLDCGRQQALSGKRKIHLTGKEFSLLELLMQNQDRVVTREMILERAWGEEGPGAFSKSIETHVANLRKKIGARKKEKIIFTVPGRGYRIGE